MIDQHGKVKCRCGDRVDTSALAACEFDDDGNRVNCVCPEWRCEAYLNRPDKVEVERTRKPKLGGWQVYVQKPDDIRAHYCGFYKTDGFWYVCYDTNGKKLFTVDSEDKMFGVYANNKPCREVTTDRRRLKQGEGKRVIREDING